MSSVSSARKLFVFMTSHAFWGGIFDNVDMTLLKSMLSEQLTSSSDILITTIYPDGFSQERMDILKEKQSTISKLVGNSGAKILYFQINDRNLISLDKAVRNLSKLLGNYEICFIWAMNYFNCAIAAMITSRRSNIRLHFQMLGLVPEETLHYSRKSFFFRLFGYLLLKIVERFNLIKSDSLSVVTKKFKDFLIKRRRIAAEKIEVIPSLFEPSTFYFDSKKREQYRKALGIKKDQILIFYTGLFQKYQEPDCLFQLMVNLQNQDLQNRLRFMVLSADLKRAADFSKKYRIKDLIVKTAQGEELNGLCNAADVGLIVRRPDRVNSFSSPTKIPEYLATGNAILLPEYIGDFGADLRDKKFILIKKSIEELLHTSINEIINLTKPEPVDFEEINEQYSTKRNHVTIQRVMKKHFLDI